MPKFESDYILSNSVFAVLDTAEDDEYDTKKSNKLWPQDSQQLANRTREVSIIISKNDGFAIEVRKGKHNSNEYVLGTKEAVEKYVESQEEDYKTT